MKKLYYIIITIIVIASAVGAYAFYRSYSYDKYSEDLWERHPVLLDEGCWIGNCPR